MAIERVLTPHVAEPAPGLWSNCLRHGDNVYIAGLVAVDADFNVLAVGDPGEQTRIIFRSIRPLSRGRRRQPRRRGADAGLPVRTWSATGRRSSPRAGSSLPADFPCSTLVEVAALVSPEMLVEVDADAIIGAGAA